MNGKFHWPNSTTPKVNINSIYCTIHHKSKDEEQEQQKNFQNNKDFVVPMLKFFLFFTVEKPFNCEQKKRGEKKS